MPPAIAIACIPGAVRHLTAKQMPFETVLLSLGRNLR